jgi:hypothetical protein
VTAPPGNCRIVEGGGSVDRAPALAGGQAWVTLQHAQIQPLMGKYCVRGRIDPITPPTRCLCMPKCGCRRRPGSARPRLRRGLHHGGAAGQERADRHLLRPDRAGLIGSTVPPRTTGRLARTRPRGRTAEGPWHAGPGSWHAGPKDSSERLACGPSWRSYGCGGLSVHQQHRGMVTMSTPPRGQTAGGVARPHPRSSITAQIRPRGPPTELVSIVVRRIRWLPAFGSVATI